jgi:hypothetical protein
MDTINVNDYQNVSWIENLAFEEVNMEESGIIRFNDHLNTQQLLEESSLTFVNKLKDRFEFYVSLFNQYRSNRDVSRSIKIFRISNTVNDFILFRNSLKLIVARRAPDVVSIGFLSNNGGLFSPRLATENQSVHAIHEIKAHVGPFNSITWRFQGEPVEVEPLVKYYLTEFVKNSSR